MNFALPIHIKVSQHNFLELKTDVITALMMIIFATVQLVLGIV